MAVIVAEKTKSSGKKGDPESVLPSASAGRSHWERAYRLPLSEIPWEIEKPPKELVELLASVRPKPGTLNGAFGHRRRALDVACGSGNYSVFLARKGFDVTGVDFSKNALEIAKKKATAAGVSIDFVPADVRHLAGSGPVSALMGRRFDFILDWSLLHHIPPADFEAYAAQFSKMLAPGGLLLLSCFSDADAPVAGRRFAIGKMGNVMHYRTREEIEAAYRPLKVLQYRACRLGKKGKHVGHCFLLGRDD